MANKLLEIGDANYNVTKFAELSARYGNISGLEILYRNATRYTRSPINRQFAEYTKIALLATKLLQEEQPSS